MPILSKSLKKHCMFPLGVLWYAPASPLNKWANKHRRFMVEPCTPAKSWCKDQMSPTKACLYLPMSIDLQTYAQHHCCFKPVGLGMICDIATASLLSPFFLIHFFFSFKDKFQNNFVMPILLVLMMLWILIDEFLQQVGVKIRILWLKEKSSLFHRWCDDFHRSFSNFAMWGWGFLKKVLKLTVWLRGKV